jgi:signal transduction histidine kinase
MPGEEHTNSLLVIDGDENLRRAIVSECDGRYVVHSAGTLDEGYRLLRELPIQVVLFDQMMTSTDLSFLEELESNFPTVVPLGIIDIAAMAHGVEVIAQERIYRYIIQPWDPTEFETTLRQAFDRHRRLSTAFRENGSDGRIDRSAIERIEELERINQQLIEENSRMAAMLRAAAHDLRNPLTAIIAVSEVLESDHPPEESEARHEYHALIHREAAWMRHMLNSILDLQQLASGTNGLHLRRVSIEEIIEAAVQTAEHHAIKKDIDLRITLRPELPPIECDPTRIRQVLDNLIGNAITFSPPGTIVTVAAVETPDGIECSVMDEGPGIADDEQSRIFLPFERGSARPTGDERSTGLGLAICRTIIDQHEGSIDVWNRAEGGSRFAFFLPFG